VSGDVNGPSSGGKSYLVKLVTSFFPDSDFCRFTAMSEKTLLYTDEPLSHRHTILSEAASLSGDFQEYVIRTLLSEGSLEYEFFEKTSADKVLKGADASSVVWSVLMEAKKAVGEEIDPYVLDLPGVPEDEAIEELPAMKAADVRGCVEAIAGHGSVDPDDLLDTATYQARYEARSARRSKRRRWSGRYPGRRGSASCQTRQRFRR
jgi:hypothetical protein